MPGRDWCWRGWACSDGCAVGCPKTCTWSVSASGNSPWCSTFSTVHPSGFSSVSRVVERSRAGRHLGLPARRAIVRRQSGQPPRPRRRRLPALGRPGREENPPPVLGVRRPGHLLRRHPPFASGTHLAKRAVCTGLVAAGSGLAGSDLRGRRDQVQPARARSGNALPVSSG